MTMAPYKCGEGEGGDRSGNKSDIGERESRKEHGAYELPEDSALHDGDGGVDLGRAGVGAGGGGSTGSLDEELKGGGRGDEAGQQGRMLEARTRHEKLTEMMSTVRKMPR